MEPELQYSEVEDNEDSITDDADVVERNVTSLITHFTHENNDGKAILTESDQDYERTIKRSEIVIILYPTTRKCFGRKGSNKAINSWCRLEE